MVDGAALGERATPRWWAASSDAQGYDLCHLAAITLLQLSCEGYDDPSLSSSAGGEGSYTAGGLELLMQHMLLNAAHADLERLGHTKPGAPPMPPATLELLTRATRRCSASTAARVRGAESLRASDLQTMQDELAGLKRTLAALRQRSGHHAVTTALSPPGESGALLGSSKLPNFGRLLNVDPVDSLAGARVERPLVMPIELSLIPDGVTTIDEASNALHHASYLCSLLSNQHGLVRDSFALCIGLSPISPRPAAPTATKGRISTTEIAVANTDAVCFWRVRR